MASRPTVVSDTSPLRYLILIKRADLLDSIFKNVLIPRGVEKELMHPSAPEQIRKWMAQRPSWLDIRELTSPVKSDRSRRLNLGEAQAIQLAIEMKERFILIDERRGRQMAADHGLAVVGTLGILLQSYRQRLIDNPIEVLGELRAAHFRVSRRLAKDFEEEVRLIQRRNA